MAPQTGMMVAILAPLLCAALIPLFRTAPNLREAVTLVTAAVLCFSVFSVVPHVLDGARPQITVSEIAPGLALSFQAEPLGMLFAIVASSLWFVNSVYTIGYMRGNGEPRQTTFFACLAIAIGSTMGIALAENLFTFFLCYEALTLSTYPLVTHHRDPESMRSGRLYLLLLIGTSMGLFLPAIIATWFIGGTLSFIEGGILAGATDPWLVGVLLALYAFGIGKAAIMPVHFWLPAAMVAPTPVSAFLHAVAVVKAGVFAVVKVVVYVFGLETLNATGANEWLIFVGCVSLILASIIALLQEDLKARLAYSTVSQLAYVVVGASLATPTSIMGSGLQILTHAAGKITLFFCAGAIYVAAHKKQIGDLVGIGKRMPLTMAAFFVASVSIIGLPPTGGIWSKWFLALGALEAGQFLVVVVLMLSSILSVAYLLPIVARAYFLPAPDVAPGTPVEVKEAPLPCLIAIGITTSLCIVLFFQIGFFERLLAGLLSPQ